MSLADLSVLVVEDHDFQRRTLVRILRNLGIGDVLEAADGEEALTVLGDAPGGADVVVCDLELPGMDGVELLRHIAARAPGQAVVIASGLEEAVLDAAEATGREHGLRVLGRLAKPITAAGLLGALERRDAGAPSAGGDPPRRTAPRPAGHGPVLELQADPATGAVAGLRVSGDGVADEELVAAACRARRRLAREGHDVAVSVVLPPGGGDDAAERLAGRAALEGLAPRGLTLLLAPGELAGGVDASTAERFVARGFVVAAAADDPGLRPAGRAGTVDELLALVPGR